MRRYAALLVLFAVSVALAGAGTARATEASHPAATRAAAARTQPRSTGKTRSSGQVRVTSSRQDPGVSAQQLLTAAVAPLARADGGHVAVAVDDLTTGAQAAYRGSQHFVTASIVKVDILATLLYQARGDVQALTPEEQALATTMIENSDDNAASELYTEDNGAPGITAVNRALGLRQTRVGTDGYWGLTSTTVDDQIRLLLQVFTRPSALTPASQAYIRYLMSHVEVDQQWGAPAAATRGTRFMVKNGWLPNPTLWEINSLGDIEHDHQRMLIAVLSDDNTGEYSGISIIEEVARRAAEAVAASAGTVSSAATVAIGQSTTTAPRLLPDEWPFTSRP
jgi:beta-lactamase class A